MSNEKQQPQPPFDEPSVLDYFKSLFRFGGERIAFSEEQSADSGQPSVIQDQSEEPQSADELETFEPFDDAQGKLSNVQASFPWRSLLALFFALIGQNTFEPPPTTSPLGIALYIAAFAMLGWAIYLGEWNLEAFKPTSNSADPLSYRRIALFISIAMSFAGFVLFKDNLFTVTNVIVWYFAIMFFVLAFWVSDKDDRLVNIKSSLKRGNWQISFSWWTLLLVAATALIFFFRFYQTTSVPPEPFSDHAEKILDVYDVSQGQTHIFFPRNTGREAIQMYWTLLVANVFGTGLSYLSLKLGTAILGFLTLPFIYLLGKEIGGKRVGLFAFILTGIGYWPNVISRVGLRFPLYPLFAAPTLFFLIRGLRTRNRNDFILSGIFLGLGLHGYSPIRIVPFVVIGWITRRSLASVRSRV